MKRIGFVLLAVLILILAFGHTHAQNVTPQTPVGEPISVRIYGAYSLTPISATAAAGSAATLTIPAPPAGQYNYVCYLALEGSNNNTPLAVTNAVTTSTNFNSFAAKFSSPSAASNDTGVLNLLRANAPGCPKSTAAAVATTFVSPASTDEAYVWYAIYFQAP